MDKVNNKFSGSIQGLIMTGWSRFTHHTVLCEVLPMSIPSLVLCLAVVERRKVGMKAIYTSVVRILGLQARLLLKEAAELHKEFNGDLNMFLGANPRIQDTEVDCFCYDAFEIGWNQEKVVFLLQKIEECTRDWVSVDY